MFPNAAPIEILWTLLMLFGLVYDLIGWSNARQDEQWRIRRQQNGLVRIATRKNIRSSFSRCLYWAIYAGIGLAAMQFGPNTPQRITFPVTVGGLFLGVLVMLVNSIFDSRVRASVQAYSDTEHEASMINQIAKRTAELTAEHARLVAQELAAKVLRTAQDLVAQQLAQTDTLAAQTSEQFTATNAKIEDVPVVTADLVEERVRKESGIGS